MNDEGAQLRTLQPPFPALLDDEKVTGASVGREGTVRAVAAWEGDVSMARDLVTGVGGERSMGAVAAGEGEESTARILLGGVGGERSVRAAVAVEGEVSTARSLLIDAGGERSVRAASAGEGEELTATDLLTGTGGSGTARAAGAGVAQTSTPLSATQLRLSEARPTILSPSLLCIGGGARLVRAALSLIQLPLVEARPEDGVGKPERGVERRLEESGPSEPEISGGEAAAAARELVVVAMAPRRDVVEIARTGLGFAGVGIGLVDVARYV
jgi:hypothetical protein